MIPLSLVLPITTAEAKAWAKVENSDEDSLISSLITTPTDFFVLRAMVKVHEDQQIFGL